MTETQFPDECKIQNPIKGHPFSVFQIPALSNLTHLPELTGARSHDSENYRIGKFRGSAYLFNNFGSRELFGYRQEKRALSAI
jgi:hypothetical protein